MKDLFANVNFEQIEHRKFPRDYVNHIIIGDCTEIMRRMPMECIDLIVTSPPYFVEKSYEKEWSLDEYEALMENTFKMAWRVLKPGAYMVVNFGDYFNKNRFYCADIPSVYPASIKFFQWGQGAALDLQATRIWRKQFSRMSIPFVCNSHPRPIFDYEHIWTFRKPDGLGKEFVNDRKLSQRGVLGEGWTAPAKINDHEAAFPVDLPLWAIDVYSKDKNDIVLDPFCGIATTLIAADQRSRRYIGIELDSEHAQTGYKRLSE